jgi:hypothetical protein
VLPAVLETLCVNASPHDAIYIFSVLFHPFESQVTKWALHALFFFEAELKLENFVKQRRRWNNGTAAGYFFLVRDCWSKVRPLIHSSHTLLSYTPLIHSSHTLLSCTPLMHSSHTLLSYTPLIHSSYTTLQKLP